MNRYIQDEFYNDPELLRRLAHRERARAMAKAAKWLYGAIARTFTRALALLKPQGRGRWIERLG